MKTNDNDNNDETKWVKNNLAVHVARLLEITERAITAKITTISTDMKPKIDMAYAAVKAYQTVANLCDVLGADIPKEVEERTTKHLNEFEDQMTLDLSTKV